MTYHTDTHVAKADILCPNLLVDATSKHDALLGELGQDVGLRNLLGEVDGRHAVRLLVGVRSDLLKTKVRDGLLDPVRGRLVQRESLSDGSGEDLRQGSVESVDELRRGGRKVRRLLGLVVLHDWQLVSVVKDQI